MKEISTILIFLMLMVFGSCKQPMSATNTPQNSGPTTASNTKWDPYVEQFLKDYFDANPQFGAYQGKHEYDGKLADWSEDGLKKEIARLKSEREKALAFKDGDLDERQRFERDYV
ncbi:MAG: hypothetical protein ABI878_13800, partial [Acidobacteriota bacterium]